MSRPCATGSCVTTPGAWMVCAMLHARGRPRKLDARQTAELVSKIEAGTDPDAGEPSRWTLASVRQWIKDRFDVDYTVEGVRQMLRRLGFRHLSPRPIHPKANPEAQEEFRHTFSRLVRGHPSRGRVGRGCSRVLPGRGSHWPEGDAVTGLGPEGNTPAHTAGLVATLEISCVFQYRLRPCQVWAR